MPNTNYAIVGAPVTDPRHQIVFEDGGVPVVKDLHGTEVLRLPADPALAAVLGNGWLTVESIGKMMVEMSERPDMSDRETDIRERITEKCLAVFAIDGALSEDDKQALLDNTQVEIVFERRVKAPVATDKNKRILVVPADGTLKDKRDTLTNGAANPDAAPPLTYQLDEFLMLDFLRSGFKEMVRGFFNGPGGQGADPAMVTALLEHIDTEVKSRIEGAGEDDVKTQILRDKVRAYHRSVGIYATNMCR